MSKDKLFYANKTFQDVVEDGFNQIAEGEGFDYIVGKVAGGTIKVVFEPNSDCFDSAVIDGVDGFGYTLVCENTQKKL